LNADSGTRNIGKFVRHLLFIVVQLRRTFLLHHSYTILPMYSSQ